MEFRIDQDRKRHCSFKIIRATTGGKIAFTLCSICSVLFLVSLVFLVSYAIEFSSYEYNSYDREDAFLWFFCAILANGVFLVAGPAGLARTCLQRNICVGLRKKERLFLEDGWLRYSFHIANDRDVNSLDEIAINLRESSLQLGPNGECVFAGGVVGWHYENMLRNSLRSTDEMEPVSSFEIWPYWSPDLYETLVAEQRRLAVL